MLTAQYKGKKLQFEKVGLMSSILIAVGIEDTPISLPNNVNMYVQLTRLENVLREKLGKTPIKGFLSFYCVKPLRRMYCDIQTKRTN